MSGDVEAARAALVRLMPYPETHALLDDFEAAIRAEADERVAVIDAARTWPCIWCGAPLIDCGYESPCCDLNDHPFATTREAIAAIRAEADERVAALRERVESLRYSEPLLHHTPEHKMWERNEETIAYLRAALDAAPEGRR